MKVLSVEKISPKVKSLLLILKEMNLIRIIDYTKWQREYYADMSVSEFNKKAVEYAKSNPLTKTKQ